MTTDTTPTAADEPTELTPMQYALLDAFKDVALSSEAPGAKYAAEQLARLTAAAFGYPLPEPVLREGGVAGYLFGNPRPQSSTAPTAEAIAAARQRRPGGGPVSSKHLALVAERAGRTTAAEVLDLRTHADPLPPDEAAELGAAAAWPFKPGDVVDDAEGAITEQLDAAPEDTVLATDTVGEWAHRGERWHSRGVYVVEPLTSTELAAEGPLKVVHVGKRDR